jgi:hypothetical protein
MPPRQSSLLNTDNPRLHGNHGGAIFSEAATVVPCRRHHDCHCLYLWLWWLQHPCILHHCLYGRQFFLHGLCHRPHLAWGLHRPASVLNAAYATVCQCLTSLLAKGLCQFANDAQDISYQHCIKKIDSHPFSTKCKLIAIWMVCECNRVNVQHECYSLVLYYILFKLYNRIKVWRRRIYEKNIPFS